MFTTTTQRRNLPFFHVSTSTKNVDYNYLFSTRFRAALLLQQYRNNIGKSYSDTQKRTTATRHTLQIQSLVLLPRPTASPESDADIFPRSRLYLGWSAMDAQ
jgi:hypothetical protein